MADLLARQPRLLVVAGDFNQRLRGGRQPKRVAAALRGALVNLDIATTGAGYESLIDHVAHSPDLSHTDRYLLASHDSFGTLSDHVGVVVSFESRG